MYWVLWESLNLLGNNVIENLLGNNVIENAQKHFGFAAFYLYMLYNILARNPPQDMARSKSVVGAPTANQSFARSQREL